jgi:hypothetical protein
LKEKIDKKNAKKNSIERKKMENGIKKKLFGIVIKLNSTS